MKKHIAAVLITTTLASPAWALQTPEAGKDDPHIRFATYQQSNQIGFIGQLKRVTTVTFPPAEVVKSVVFGNPDQWETTSQKEVEDAPLTNNVPLWAKEPGRSNIQITTKSGDRERVYQFAAEARPGPADGSDDPDATFGLIFSGGAARPAPTSVVPLSAIAGYAPPYRSVAVRMAAQPLVHLAPPENYRYVARGDRALVPSEVSDNGTRTLLRFPGNTRLPAPFAIAADKSEEVVPFSMDGDAMIIQRTVRELRLRLGGSVLEVFNLTYDPVGTTPSTGTDNPDVIREIKRAAAR